ncbi:MAG TPA: ABC transporter permease [Bryobacteraceae bacterium]|nr:ABC transporter permease [Bryobacteraceae bacterium]
MRWKSRKSREQELERELQSHLDLAAAEHEENGLSPDDALNAARRDFGNATRVKEQAREMWGWTLVETVLRDVRQAARTLRKSPGFAATAILTLAIGIGASTAVFTLVDSVVLKPLSYRDSGQLVTAWENLRFRSYAPGGPNPRHADLWRKEATSFSGLALVQQGSIGLSLGADHPRVLGAVTCTANLLDVLQVMPALGRGFLPEDDVKGHDDVVILTWSVWQSMFRSDPHVIGRTVRIADTSRVVIGVLPASFRFPNASALRAANLKQSVSGALEPAIFVPAALELDRFGWGGDYGNWVALARLKPGIEIRQAQAELAVIEDRMIRQMPANAKGQPGFLYASLEPMQEAIVGDTSTRLWLLMAAVMGLMLIACLNLANAQLGRSVSRQREAGVRIALGAARWRLVWSSLTENLLLAVIGGAAGIALADATLRLFRQYTPLDLPRLSEVHLNLTVLIFSIILTVGSSLLFGMLPALKLMRTDPQSSMKQGDSHTLGSRRSGLLRGSLIALQVVGCTALLMVTGLFANSLLYLLRQDRGFETGNVAVAEVRLTDKAFGTPQSRLTFDDGVLQNLRDIPGVRSAALINSMPLEGETWIEELVRVDKPDLGAVINLRWTSPGYFDTLQQKLVAGRFIEERDRNLSSVVISEGLANALWQNENPIGSPITTEGRKFTVVGVVADARSASLKTAPPRMAWLHYHDRPPYSIVFMARSTQPADQLFTGMRQAIWSHAPDITISRVKTLDSQVKDSLAPERFQTTILIAFGAAALLLAMLGIYGVLSYSMISRMREIGLRMALGATRRGIYTLAARSIGTPLIVGLIAGLTAGVLAGRAIRKLLYGTQAFDSSVMLTVIALFLAAAFIAAYLPARRAAILDPMETLRSE